MASTKSVQDRRVESRGAGISRLVKGHGRIAVVLLITLLAGGSMVARRQRGGDSRPPQTTAGRVDPGNRQGMSILSLTPNTPSKEYIRLGGKLVAIEEPAP